MGIGDWEQPKTLSTKSPNSLLRTKRTNDKKSPLNKSPDFNRQKIPKINKNNLPLSFIKKNGPFLSPENSYQKPELKKFNKSNSASFLKNNKSFNRNFNLYLSSSPNSKKKKKMIKSYNIRILSTKRNYYVLNQSSFMKANIFKINSFDKKYPTQKIKHHNTNKNHSQLGPINLKINENFDKNLLNSESVRYKNNEAFSTNDIIIKVKRLKKFSINSMKIKNNNNIYKYDEKYIIKIQSNFRRYIFQKQLYNNINIYFRYIKAIQLLNNVCNKISKGFFIKKLRKISNYNFNSEYNKLKKEIKEYKIYKDKYIDNVEEMKKIKFRNYEINKKYFELKKELKNIKSKNNNINSTKSKTRNKIKEKEKNKIENNFIIQNIGNIIFNSENKIKEEAKPQYKKEVDKKKSIRKKINKDESINKKQSKDKDKNGELKSEVKDYSGKPETNSRKNNNKMVNELMEKSKLNKTKKNWREKTLEKFKKGENKINSMSSIKVEETKNENLNEQINLYKKLFLKNFVTKKISINREILLYSLKK